MTTFADMARDAVFEAATQEGGRNYALGTIGPIDAAAAEAQQKAVERAERAMRRGARQARYRVWMHDMVAAYLRNSVFEESDPDRVVSQLSSVYDAIERAAQGIE